MRRAFFIGVTLAAMSLPAGAGDNRDTTYGAVQPDPQTTADRAVWGAIAYSPSTGKDGIFWGAATREEARETALRHCRNAIGQKDGAGDDCALAVLVYNDWDDRRIGRTASAHNRAPHCGAVAVGERHRYAAARGRSLDEARDGALAACGDKNGACKVQQDLCT